MRRSLFRLRRSLVLMGVALIGAMLVLAGCSVAQESDTTADAPEASGAAIIEYLNAADYQNAWQHLPGVEPMYTGGEPHGALLSTYFNAIALQAITDKAGSIPEGGMVVKENYMPDGKLAAITVMYKAAGYENPEANNWFFLKYAPDGVIEAEGPVQGCTECHGDVRDNDFLFTADVK
ncbi:MAG: cytochrome P460 family protein [Chloroflexota bacterium]|nr:cytochrome P460 family protein [Chloroflexota bacterium]MDE2839319.1 cytochrome P460 family protein [Chloroflexota bacterium]MDE2929877.1 cytochrome P460 family protein [Chloroflexota bacterium]